MKQIVVVWALFVIVGTAAFAFAREVADDIPRCGWCQPNQPMYGAKE